MNASALLTSQGWLGPGHALDSRLTDYGAPTYKQKGHRGLAYDPNAAANNTITSGNGLVKPLLVSQRGRSKFGIGKKAHEPQSGNEWWLKGFQSALQNIGKSESERSSAVNSGTSTPRNGTSAYIGKHSGLYNNFTAGQMMKGTLDEWNEQQKSTKKRKSDLLEEANGETQSRRVASPVKRQQTAEELAVSVEYLKELDKSRKKSHKEAQSTDLEQFAIVSQFLGVTEDERRKKKRRKELAELLDTESDVREESKEEQRARRKRQKERKENGTLSLAQMVEEELARLSSLHNSEGGEISDSEKTKGKAERKKKKRIEKAS